MPNIENKFKICFQSMLRCSGQEFLHRRQGRPPVFPLFPGCSRLKAVRSIWPAFANPQERWRVPGQNKVLLACYVFGLFLQKELWLVCSGSDVSTLGSSMWYCRLRVLFSECQSRKKRFCLFWHGGGGSETDLLCFDLQMQPDLFRIG